MANQAHSSNIAEALRDDELPSEARELWESRHDLQQAFDLATQQDVARYVGWWLWAIGDGHETVSREETRSWLRDELSKPSEAVDDAESFAITRELHFLWSYLAELQQRFDLSSSQGKLGLLGWYLFMWRDRRTAGVAEWEKQSLNSISPAISVGNSRQTTLIAHALWHQSDALREAYPLTNPNDADGLLCWSIWNLSPSLSAQISPEIDLSAEQIFDHWVSGHRQSSGYVDYLALHRKRLLTTFDLLAPHVQEGHRILEVGGLSFLAFALRCKRPSAVTIGTDSDLRYPLALADGQFDAVIFTEVLEHLKDQESTDLGDIDHFTFSGVQSMMSELRRMTRPGGVMILSTPNVTGLENIHKLLTGDHPFSYPPHVREFTPREVTELVAEHGFDIMQTQTIDVWYNPEHPEARDTGVIKSILIANGFSLENREDCTFLLARRKRA